MRYEKCDNEIRGWVSIDMGGFEILNLMVKFEGWENSRLVD
jgi:hypothetical protein